MKAPTADQARRVLSRLRPKNLLASRIQSAFTNVVPRSYLFDVGASYFPHTRWRMFRESRRAEWVLIDPNLDSLSYVDSWKFASVARKVGVALGGESGDSPLYLTPTITGSSIYRPDVPEGMRTRLGPAGLDYFFPYETSKINLKLLADIAAPWDDGRPRLLKIDVQGSEFPIVQSVEDWISSGKLVGVELEVSLLAQPLYRGATTLPEIVSWFYNLGWEMIVMDVIEAPPRGSFRASQSYPHEADIVFAPRPDTAANLSLEARQLLLVLYVSCRLFGEADRLLTFDRELSASLENEGFDSVGSTRKLRAGLKTRKII